MVQGSTLPSSPPSPCVTVPVPHKPRVLARVDISVQLADIPPTAPQIIIAAIPLLVPIVASLVFYRFSKSSKLSRARIKAMEGSESYQQRLIHIFSDLENRVESAFVGVVHDVAEFGVNTPVSPEEQANGTRKELKANGDADSTAPSLLASRAREKSFLTEAQKGMVKALNTIPNMKKYRAFFAEVRNSHAIIISRDPRRFEIHEKGVEILRHWAERFDL